MRKALIILLIIFVSFGLGMYVVFGEVTTAMMFSLLYGGILTAVLTLLYNTSSKSIQMQSSNVNREKEMEVPVSFADAFHLCKESIHQLNRAQIIEEDAQIGSIRVKTGMSIRTWGDVVQYKVKKVTDSKSMIHIHSRPIVVTTLIDYGKNKENIKKISDYFELYFR